MTQPAFCPYNSYCGLVQTLEGHKIWYNNGLYHRNNGRPAIILQDGTKEWYVNGKRHRDNGLPAIEHANGLREWYVNDKRHRDNDLPAIEHTNGIREWYVNGKRHRDNGLPAVEMCCGIKMWYVDGKLHRKGGRPAIERYDGVKKWYVNDLQYSEKQVKSIHRIEKWYKRMVQKRFTLLVWRVMTPIYFHPDELGGKNAIKALKEYDIEKEYEKGCM
jgi:hypothetical protein